MVVHFSHMVDCLLCLENTIELHEHLDEIGALISALDSVILYMLNPSYMGPFMTAQKLMEARSAFSTSMTFETG